MPPRRHAVLELHITQLGDETGLWCPHCSLPSAIARHVAVEINDRPFQIVSAAVCMDCGAQL